MRDQPGKIIHLDRYKQLNDFSGLLFGDITPTDIDALIEYKNAGFVLYEFKHVSNPEMQYGQRLAIERMCRALGKPSVALLCAHNEPRDAFIDCAGTDVVKIYRPERMKYGRAPWRWVEPRLPMSAHEATGLFLDWLRLNRD